MHRERGVHGVPESESESESNGKDEHEDQEHIPLLTLSVSAGQWPPRGSFPGSRWRSTPGAATTTCVLLLVVSR